MQFGILIKSLAGKAGIKADDETLKKILAFGETSQFEVPEEFAQALERNLLTEESARSNSNVRNKLFAEALNGVDFEADSFANEFEFDEADKTSIKGIQKNTNEKLRLIKGAVKKLMDKKGEGSKKDDVVLQKEIDTLNEQANSLKESYETKISELNSKHLTDKKNWHMQTYLAGKPLPKNGLPADVNILTAKTLIEQEMAKHGLSIIYDEADQPHLKQKKDGTEIDYFVDNKKIGYSDFLDGVLAQNKFLQVNDPNPKSQEEGKTLQPDAQLPKNDAVVSGIDAQLASLGVTV